jgi:hypothetical protein
MRDVEEVVTVVTVRTKKTIQMIKVSIEVRSGTARFVVAVKADNIQQALNIVQTRYPEMVAAVKFPIDPEGFL